MKVNTAKVTFKVTNHSTSLTAMIRRNVAWLNYRYADVRFGFSQFHSQSFGQSGHGIFCSRVEADLLLLYAMT